ncbi:Tn3 family transposase [Saccharopolyspora shandongensis]|uniref:Tn3 family transposase n=1 Tax=Saccharopolyspora shandongensis TaxID=418495 RepID=UPI00341A8E1F
MTLLRRLGKHSHENRLYRAFRELGRVIRTVTPLRFLSEPELRGQITAITTPRPPTAPLRRPAVRRR